MEHLLSLNLFELAEMQTITDRPELAHLMLCADCAVAFLIFKSTIEESVGMSLLMTAG
jgi:hypothetical protein